jgi:hypothetical protein
MWQIVDQRIEPEKPTQANTVRPSYPGFSQIAMATEYSTTCPRTIPPTRPFHPFWQHSCAARRCGRGDASIFTYDIRTKNRGDSL